MQTVNFDVTGVQKVKLLFLCKDYITGHAHLLAQKLIWVGSHRGTVRSYKSPDPIRGSFYVSCFGYLVIFLLQT
jgi:hypothetical protein